MADIVTTICLKISLTMSKNNLVINTCMFHMYLSKLIELVDMKIAMITFGKWNRYYKVMIHHQITYCEY